MYKDCNARLKLLMLIKLNMLFMNFGIIIWIRIMRREEVIKNKTCHILDKLPACIPDLFRLSCHCFRFFLQWSL
jgi:hypothetical protein